MPQSRQVASHNQRRLFATTGDQSEEQVRGVLIEGNVTLLVHDQQAVASQPGKFRVKFSPRVGLLQASDSDGGSVKQHSMARPVGPITNADGEAGFVRRGGGIHRNRSRAGYRPLTESSPKAATPLLPAGSPG